VNELIAATVIGIAIVIIIVTVVTIVRAPPCAVSNGL
jgi:hypothetical protein